MKTHAFETYREKYENVRMKREDGILEVALHTRGGPLEFNGYVHEALVHAFRDIGDDPDNHVVILTGTGDEFCTRISPDGFDFFTPTGYDKILREGTKILENILDIEVPMIAAINGPVTVHSEYALLCDIVLAAEGAYFQDAPHPAFGIVPGDGLHVVWPEVIGEIRGRYFLLSGQKLSAAEAKGYGAVNEVVHREALLPRAWELARYLKKQSPLTLRYTRMALSTRFRRRLQESLSYGLALEGISAAQVAASSWLRRLPGLTSVMRRGRPSRARRNSRLKILSCRNASRRRCSPGRRSRRRRNGCARRWRCALAHWRRDSSWPPCWTRPVARPRRHASSGAAWTSRRRTWAFARPSPTRSLCTPAPNAPRCSPLKPRGQQSAPDDALEVATPPPTVEANPTRENTARAPSPPESGNEWREEGTGLGYPETAAGQSGEGPAASRRDADRPAYHGPPSGPNKHGSDGPAGSRQA